MHEALVAGLSFYAFGVTVIAIGVSRTADNRSRLLAQSRWRERTYQSLLNRRRRHIEGLPQPRKPNGQFTAA